jgi:hypothetical protein
MRPVEVSLGRYGSDLTIDELTREVLETLTARTSRESSGDAGFQDLVDMLCTCASSSSVALFVDEVPIAVLSDSGLATFQRFFGSLVESVKMRSGTDVRFVFASVDAPPRGVLSEKFREHFEILEFPVWSSDELLELLMLVEGVISLKVGSEFVSTLISACGGSPRVLKSFLRRRLMSGSRESESASLSQVI